MFSADTDSEKECCNTAYKAGQTLRKVVDIGAEDARALVEGEAADAAEAEVYRVGISLEINLLYIIIYSLYTYFIIFNQQLIIIVLVEKNSLPRQCSVPASAVRWISLYEVWQRRDSDLLPS